MLPLAGHRAPGDPVLLGPGAALDAGTFFARAQALARALPEAGAVINLCETRAGFMLGFAAALLRGQVSLLPPGQSAGDWAGLPARHPGAYALHEGRIDAPGSFALAGHLTADVAPLAAIPAIAPGQAAAILFTSGSTGEPAAHAKTWGQLCAGADALLAALGWPREPALAIVGSVPPQHMFGLETTVLLPWRAGVPVHAGKPLLAADLEAALRDCARPAWWMATPMHLRAPLQSGAALEGLAGIVASTMSLPPPLAREAEARWNVPVVEIYGSTETGALATRRAAADADWAPLPGVVIRGQGDGDEARFSAEGPHIPGVTALGDRLALGEGGRFRWLGRANDLVKVAGRRASLAALNRALLEIPGIDDGVITFPPQPTPAPDESHPARRLAAFYASATLEPGEVVALLRERIDPAFLPRPIHRVAHLPRNANGKLPQAAVDALFAARESQVVDAAHPAIPGHFPGNPIVPGVVILARVEAALRERFPGQQPATLTQARFHVPLRPGEAFTIEAAVEEGRARFTVRRADGTVVASGQWQLAVAP